MPQATAGMTRSAADSEHGNTMVQLHAVRAAVRASATQSAAREQQQRTQQRTQQQQQQQPQPQPQHQQRHQQQQHQQKQHMQPTQQQQQLTQQQQPQQQHAAMQRRIVAAGEEPMTAYWKRLGDLRAAYLSRVRQAYELAKKQSASSVVRWIHTKKAEQLISWMSATLIPMLQQTEGSPCGVAKFTPEVGTYSC
jgi:hypothetical protein